MFSIYKVGDKTAILIRGDGGDKQIIVINPDRSGFARSTEHNLEPDGTYDAPTWHVVRVKYRSKPLAPHIIRNLLRCHLCPDWGTENGLGWAFDH